MKHILTVLRYDILRTLRNRKRLMLLLAFPLLLTLILGTALEGAGSDRTVEKLHITAAIVDEDQGVMAEQLISFFKSEELNKIVKVRMFSSSNKAKKALREQKVGAVIIITVGFTKDVHAHRRHDLEMINNQEFDGMVVRDILDSYVNGINAFEAAQTLTSKLTASNPETIVDTHTLSVQGKKPTAMDYYAVTMLIMMVMLSAGVARETVREEVYSTIGLRMKSLPLKAFENFIGKAFGAIFTIFLQIIVLLIAFYFLFGVNLGSNLLPIIGICFLFGFTMILITMALSLLLTPDTADHILDLIIPIATFIAGGFVRIPFFETNPIMVKIRMLLPNSLAQQMVFQKIYGGETSIQTNLIFLICILLLALVFVIFGLRRYQNGHLAK